jgi:methylated-DNA-[protein]-cysteine S-methyltransferase
MLEWLRFETAREFAFGVVASEAGIRAIELNAATELPGRESASNPRLRQAVAQLRAYFAGELRDFDLPLDMQGTDFQRRVWDELRNIPYGETRSYSFVANTMGAPKAVRAVGAANGRNPIPIVVPCHRVIGASGSLVGYGGGLPLKSFLLDLEARHSHLFQPSLDRESGLRLFDQASERRRKPSAAQAAAQPRDSGWKREDLYGRGRSR